MSSLFSPFINIVKTVIKIVSGRSGGIEDVIFKFIKYIPQLLNSITTIIDMRNSENELSPDELKILIDEALIEFDDLTGETGLSFIPENIRNIDVEEQALDNFKEFLRGMLYMIYKIVPSDFENETE